MVRIALEVTIKTAHSHVMLIGAAAVDLFLLEINWYVSDANAI